MEIVERDDRVPVDELRASVVPMKPAPPVMKIRFPSSIRRRLAWTPCAISTSSGGFVLRRPIEPDERAATESRLAAGHVVRVAVCRSLRPRRSSSTRAGSTTPSRGRRRSAARGERPRNLEAPPGVDERPIEIPWCLRALRPGERGARRRLRVRRAGLPRRPRRARRRDRASTSSNGDVPGLASVLADLRELPFADGAFDVAIAISTLEHVGRDNTQYGLDGGGWRLARRLRSASCGACPAALLVTVPTGERRAADPSRRCTSRRSGSPVSTPGFVVFEDELYELTPEGWRSVAELSPGTAIRHARAGRVGRPVRRAPSGDRPRTAAARATRPAVPRRGPARHRVTSATPRAMNSTAPTVMPPAISIQTAGVALPAVERTDERAVRAGRRGRSRPSRRSSPSPAARPAAAS